MRFYLVTLGCPKNSVDSEMMASLLRQDGHQPVSDARHADVLIVNTCAFIADARSESFSAIHELALRKRRWQRLVVVGCMVERDSDEIKRRAPAVDALLGARSWPQIRQIVAGFQEARPGSAYVPAEIQERALVTSVTRIRQDGASAYIKIADGCDASCGYCAIPLIKGPQHSKQPADVLREARELAAQGVREITLIAQDTTAYGRDLGFTDALPDLVETLSCALPELLWLRILYAYPQHITPRLIACITAMPNVCHYLDVPLQHGAPSVLRRMRRSDNIPDMLQTIQALREAVPDIALRSTFIVGYPGETDDEFEQLLEFMQLIHFDNVGVFRYSRERGTFAADLPGQVPAEVAEERFQRAMLAQQQISLQNNLAQVGRRMQVLVEGASGGLTIGRCYRQAPEIDGLTLISGSAQAGSVLSVAIVSAQEYDLRGELAAT
ncbi:MAG: 30S ribosomal protein S12 methylthiotransferase RimO [Chloroflexi bacterium]|nr:30S ribosomal protein S12 methylthiotransferase RimO [Chloroflexota bacterium]